MKIVTSLVWPGLYHAIDEDSYDGAIDSPTRHQVGLGTTEESAIADLKEEIDLYREPA